MVLQGQVGVPDAAAEQCGVLNQRLYLRYLRIIVMLLALFITPVWYLLVKDASRVPEALSFIVPE